MIFSFAKHKKIIQLSWHSSGLNYDYYYYIYFLLIIIILQKMLCKYQISNLNCFGKDEN